MTRSEAPDTTSRGEWIESREGMVFFLNAVLVAPELVVLVPVVTRAVVRALGFVRRPSPILDPVPMVAAHVLPWVGWLLVVPVALVVWNLRLEARPGPRRALWLFLALHLSFLAYTVGRWIGVA